jgi:ABC-type glycerol-3-phosphate transport system substrate-binding protein
MKRQPLIILVVLLVLVPFVLPAGGAKDTGAATASGPVQISVWSIQSAVGKQRMLSSDYPLSKMVMEQTGVNWELLITEGGDLDTAFNLRLAADDWPEAISTSGAFRDDHIAKLVDAKVILPLDAYYKDAKYPNIRNMRQNVVKFFTRLDGHIDNFPSSVYQDEKQPWGYWAAAVWAVRPDYLAAVNMKTDDLKTLAGVEKFLRAVKAAGLKNADGLPVYGMSNGENLSFWRIILPTFGVSVAGQGFEMVGGKLVHFRDNPQTKVAFQWLNTMWNEGLIDPEALSQKNDTLREKLMNKRIALQADWAWPYWQTVTAGKTAVTEMVHLPYPAAPGVAKPGVNVTYNPNGHFGMLVTKNAKNPAAIAGYVNYVYASLDPAMSQDAKWEHQLDLQYGKRGTFWDWDPTTGKPNYVQLGALKEASSSGDYGKFVELGFGSPIIVQGNDSNYFTTSLTTVLDWIFTMHKFYYNQPNVSPARPYDTVKLSAEGLWTKNADILGRVDLEYWAKAITSPAGQFEANWKAYQDQLQQQGNWSQTRAEWEAAYAAQSK